MNVVLKYLYNSGMENRLNREGIKKYSERFTNTIADQFFRDRTKISGTDVLELQPIRQVNLFVIKNLFKQWQKETGKLRSKYFDYENEEVKNALREFMNTLSRHISISKNDFIPLFQSATEETVLLIFSPYDFYTHILEMNDDAMKVEDLKRILRYVKVNKNLLEVMIQKVEEQHLAVVNRNNLPGLLDEVFASIDDTPEDIEKYLKEFTAVIPLGENDLYTVEETAPLAVPENMAEEEPDIDHKPEHAGINEQDVQQNTGQTQKTLHDELSGERKNTLADIHSQQKISSILDNITINQRFMFINTLFDGDDNRFKEAVEVLEGHNNHQNAIDYLHEQFPNWDQESEEVQEFLEVLSKRF